MVGSTELEFEIKPEPPVFSGLNKTDRHQLHNIGCEDAFFWPESSLSTQKGRLQRWPKFQWKYKLLMKFYQYLYRYPVPVPNLNKLKWNPEEVQIFCLSIR